MHLHRLITAAFLLPVTLCFIAYSAKSDGRPSAKSGAKAAIAKSATSSPVSYQETIEPYFKANCTTCHSALAHSSGFVIDTAVGLLKGGTKFGSKDIVPGSAKTSKIIAYLRGTQQPRMPMNGEPASEEQTHKIETWIDQGAKIDAVKLGWPYTKPAKASIPKVEKTIWVRNPIDNFILAKLEAKKLAPAPADSKVSLLRRVYADLVGMPPTPNEAKAFLNDASPAAYTKVVDRLLADPRYGERWARHWLDLVRYADSNGFENDVTRPHAWRFRDYVIRSLNADKPYDRFLKEQLAGDELYPDDPDAMTATGYIRLGPWDDLSTDHPQRWQDYLNDVTDTTSSVMLGLTSGCARCHNHKYDRISQADYYRMQSFFKATKWVESDLPHPERDIEVVRKERELAESKLKQPRADRDVLREGYRQIVLAEKRKTAKPSDKIETNDDEINQRIDKTDGVRRSQLDNEIGHWEGYARPYESVAEVVRDEGKKAPVTHLLLRGNLLTPGPEVQPGYIASLDGGVEKPANIPNVQGDTTGRRSALANWIANKDNPMTARVLVNRLWQHHFGRGIVNTPSDFGRNGDAPTHPELLDWLAQRFMDEGWSLKKIHRLILLSNAYQQSTQNVPLQAAAYKIDPTNKLLWRMNRIRLEGETLRDSILQTSGRLNPISGGPGVYPKLSEEVLSTGSTHKWGGSSEADGLRRTIYVFQRRSLPLPIVEAFDGPDMTNTCPRRSTTTIAPQALAMFNGEFTRTEAGYFAERVSKEAGTDTIKQVQTAYEIALIRRPTPAQQKFALEFISKQTQLHLLDGTGNSSNKSGVKNVASEAAPSVDTLKKARQSALTDLCHVLINTNEFLYLD